MKTPTPIAIIFALISILEINAQYFTHDIGIFVGSTSLQPDYGKRHNFASEWNNKGTTISFAHYLSFYKNTLRWDPNNILRNHIMVKTELKYVSTVNLEHYGRWAEKNTYGGEQLRAMKGSVKMIDIGVNLELFLHTLEEFVRPYGDIAFNPFLTFGINYSFYTNTLTSDLGDWEENINVLPYKYTLENALDIGDGRALSLSGGLGTRYKLTSNIDLAGQFSYQYFFSDAIDGLQANVIENKNNEWLFSLEVGIIYHLNFNSSLFNTSRKTRFRKKRSSYRKKRLKSTGCLN